ncbi:TorF family putative porin [Kinneretia aquatilis]|uniref:TorF family putative porin n=1 Tax=Kinneretia aquatilis TaxID=2070761 RepID=UPI0014951A3D|nr:TorF family putative porin [Paucibacter aquatile]WIV96637.1 TorF family putative porin [Paucibacter aquatile]
MKTSTSFLTLTLALTSLSFNCLAQATAPAAPAATPEHSLTGNLSLNSDYRFRGISQSWKLPALQGGLDYAHRSGFYAGTWASNVSGNSYSNGAGLELDLYAGFKFPLTQDLTLDLGALAYVYPGAKLNSAPGVATDKKYDNLDLYVGLTAGAFSAKLSIAATDYFGLNSDTAGYAYFSSLPAAGGSKGSAYLDLNYNLDLGSGLSLGTHLGHLSVKHYGDLSYSDIKISLSKEIAGLNWTGALVGTDAKRDFYQAGNAAGQNAKRLGNTGLVLSVAKTF